MSSASPAAPSSEERLLAMAVRALRTENDASAALAALDQYRRRYANGRLSVEAGVLRIDALTKTNRGAEALTMLDGLDLDRLPGAPERHVQRGELRARAGRCAAARDDFGWVLAHAREADRDAFERALWGRAQCWQREGRQGAARADASAYLQRFPGGRFSVQADRLLKTTAQ
jgi:hypothetical protein